MRKHRSNNLAVSGLMGVILMVAVVIAISATLFYSTNMIASKTDIDLVMVSMMQSKEKINIIDVSEGPLYRDDFTIRRKNTRH